MPFTAPCSRVILGGMTLAVPGATGFVALAQRAVIKHVRSCLSTVRRPNYRTAYGYARRLRRPGTSLNFVDGLAAVVAAEHGGCRVLRPWGLGSAAGTNGARAAIG